MLTFWWVPIWRTLRAVSHSAALTAAAAAAAAAPAEAAPVRARLLRLIETMSDGAVLRLGEALLPDVPPANHEDDPRNPLIVSEGEAHARIEEGLAQSMRGEVVPLEQYLARQRFNNLIERLARS